MRVASRRFLAMRTWSVGLTEPSSIERFWIFMMLYTLDINTTNTVPATVFTMIGPWPRLTRSRPINTNFLNGDLNTSTIMNAISENNRVYSSWIICLSLCVFRERGTVKISKKRDVGECKLEWGYSNECGAENNWRDQTKEIKWTNERGGLQFLSINLATLLQKFLFISKRILCFLFICNNALQWKL